MIQRSKYPSTSNEFEYPIVEAYSVPHKKTVTKITFANDQRSTVSIRNFFLKYSLRNALMLAANFYTIFTIYLREMASPSYNIHIENIRPNGLFQIQRERA